MHPDGQLNGFNNVNGGGVKHAEITGHILEGDLPAARVPELHNLENASSQSLFHIVHKILDDSIENRKEDVPDRVACLLKKLVQMIEQRCSKQAEDFKKQNNLYKTREEKYQFKTRVFKTLVTGAMEENEVLMNQLHHIKTEKTMVEEKKKLEDVELIRLRKENNDRNLEISQLKQEFEVTRDAYENRCIQLETDAMEIKSELENKIINLENLLTDSRKKVKELEKFTESKFQRWKKKERCYKNFMDFQYGSLKELRMGSESIKQEVLMTQQIYTEEINQFGMKIQGLVDAAQNYHAVLTENRKLYNEVQDLKGNIRVYCRIRPFLKGQSQRQTTIEYIGDNGELVVTNPSQKAKESHRLFKFNKVFSPAATQEEVFIDTQPLIRSVLDGYNVCIFAYGQTGSGKTYTMTGPNVSSPEDWGVNYRALNDLFHLSQVRRNSFEYEIGVQMVEIYNEQVRDLLSSNITQKRLGIWNSTQPNGLAVPDASMHSVTSTADVLDLMNVGLMNRAVGATALNERSSRSHSVLTVHVRGTDLETNAVLRGNLHLVDLAGSERVDRSEATGDRLREAQHINKSLSALGDVIFALAQKSQHVPYRNSKLTQVLQSSLGGQAKTLMFVQLNPDVESFSETISTLKFAERVSGVELGAARSNKEGRGVRELMEQVTNLKDSLTKKDEEISRLRTGKTSSGEKSLPRRYGSSSSMHSMGELQSNGTPARDKSVNLGPKAASDIDNCSEFSDKQSETGSQRSTDEFRHCKLVTTDDDIRDLNDDIELLGLGDADSDERLSDISDGVLSMGTETDGSMSSIVELTLFPETAKAPIEPQQKPSVPAKIPRPPPPQKAASSSQKPVRAGSSSQRQGLIAPSRPSLTKGGPRAASSSSAKKSTSGSSSLIRR
ncbi:putative minus-end-directed kinesin ATPase [Helianthus annuus]|nr:putative minus-end-directed kinesin ATPase [Helianthus annuus]KAJ0670385.1 putative minus-end-directed kinesin ATPase [Helianthus annuus]